MRNELSLDQIRDHWKNWATTYGTDLRATTKTGTAKQVEIAALLKTVHAIRDTLPEKPKFLEVGCGNGYNLLALHKAFPDFKYEGIDLVDEMVTSAEQLRDESGVSKDSMSFSVGDALNLKTASDQYDCIFTVRCLININTDELQLKAMKDIAARVKKGGYFLMLENSQSSYGKQNLLRQVGGLEMRTPSSFNHFFNEDSLNKNLPSYGLKHIRSENITSLHDIALYVLVPMINGGKVDYEHPIVQAAMQLSMGLFGTGEPFGDFGQNRLYLYQKQ